MVFLRLFLAKYTLNATRICPFYDFARALQVDADWALCLPVLCEFKCTCHSKHTAEAL